MADKYWIGLDGDLASDDTKWSTTSGGTNDTTAPVADDVAHFDSGGNTDCTWDVDDSITITCDSTYTATITLGANITTTGIYQFVQYGTFDTADYDFTVQTYMSAYGTIYFRSSTVRLGTPSSYQSYYALSLHDTAVFNGGSGDHYISGLIFRAGATTLTTGLTKIIGGAYGSYIGVYNVDGSNVDTTVGEVVVEPELDVDITFSLINPLFLNKLRVRTGVEHKVYYYSTYGNEITVNTLIVERGTFETKDDNRYYNITVNNLAYLYGVLDTGTASLKLKGKLYSAVDVPNISGTDGEIIQTHGNLTSTLTGTLAVEEGKHAGGMTAGTEHLVNYNQGVGYDGAYLYFTANSWLAKYTTDYVKVLEDTNAVYHCSGCNHMGDFDVWGGVLYIPAAYYDGSSPLTNGHIMRFRADDLAYLDSVDISPIVPDASSLSIDNDNGIIYVGTYTQSNSKLFKYDLHTLSYLGTLELSQTIDKIQGVACKDGFLYITSDEDDSIYKVTLGGLVLGTVFTYENSTEIEGLCWQDDKLLVLENDAATYRITELTNEYDYIDSFERTITEMGWSNAINTTISSDVSYDGQNSLKVDFSITGVASTTTYTFDRARTGTLTVAFYDDASQYKRLYFNVSGLATPDNAERILLAVASHQTNPSHYYYWDGPSAAWHDSGVSRIDGWVLYRFVLDGSACTLKISTDDGTTWTTVATITGGATKLRSVRIDAYAGYGYFDAIRFVDDVSDDLLTNATISGVVEADGITQSGNTVTGGLFIRNYDGTDGDNRVWGTVAWSDLWKYRPNSTPHKLTDGDDFTINSGATFTIDLGEVGINSITNDGTVIVPTGQYAFTNSLTNNGTVTGNLIVGRMRKTSITKDYMTITISSSTAHTDYPLEVEIDYKHGMSTDFSNLRFYDASGNPLSYWQYAVEENIKAWYIVKTDLSSTGTEILVRWNTGESDTGSMDDVFDSSSAVFDDFNTFINATVYNGTGEYYKNYAPRFLHLPDGRYMVVWKYGGDTSYSGTQMSVAYSSDDGATWTSRAKFTAIPDDGTNLVHFSPWFYKTENKIYMFYQSEDVSNYPDKRASKLYVKESEDGITWGDATEIYSDDYGLFICGYPFKMSNGEIMIPAWRDDDVHYAPSPLVSSSLTTGWSIAGTIDYSALELNETNIVEKPDGTLVAYMRTAAADDTNLYVSTSNDYGRTWSAATALITNPQITPLLLDNGDGDFIFVGASPVSGKNYLNGVVTSAPETLTTSYANVTTMNINYDSTVFFSNGSITKDDNGNIIICYGFNDERVMFLKTTKETIESRVGSRWTETNNIFSFFSSSNGTLKSWFDDKSFLLSKINIEGPAKIIARVLDSGSNGSQVFGFGRYHYYYSETYIFDDNCVMRYGWGSPNDVRLLCTNNPNRTYSATPWLSDTSNYRIVRIDWNNSTGVASIENIEGVFPILRDRITTNVPTDASLPVFIGMREMNVNRPRGFFDWFVAFHYDDSVSYSLKEWS